jgi:hypothetical protein
MMAGIDIVVARRTKTEIQTHGLTGLDRHFEKVVTGYQLNGSLVQNQLNPTF